MNKRGKTALVPRLRFPEFKKEWQCKPFDEAFDFHQTNTFSRNEMNTEQGNVRNIHYGDILIKYGCIISESSTIPFINNTVDLTRFRKNSYLQNGDIIIADTAEDLTAGKAVEIQNIDCYILSGLHTMLCRPRDITARKYFGYYLNSPVYHDSIVPLITGSKVSSISKFNIRKTIVMTPSFPEQQKIADCLSSLDDLITAEGKKFDAYKAHKKGLMQKLFPAEGKNVPELRFSEFRGCGEWVEKKLEEVADYENGKAHESDIIEKGRYIVVNSKFISTEGEVRKYTNLANLLANKGDILMVLSDVPNGRAVAKCFLADKQNTYTVNQRICRLTPQNAVGLLLFHIINRNSYFLAFDDGVKQTNLKKDDVLSCSLILPKEPSEQQKIADCLSSLDELITAQAEKIKALKAHKKGLRQGLFPTIEEVGG